MTRDLRNYAVSAIVVAALGAGLYGTFNIWMAWVGAPTFDIPNRDVSATEVRVRDLIGEFRDDLQPVVTIKVSELFSKPVEKICFQFGKETQADFERVTGVSVSGYHQIMRLGEAWWVFYSDGTYEPVYLGSSSDRFYHAGSESPLKKCISASRLELRRRTSYSSDRTEITEMVYDFKEGEQK